MQAETKEMLRTALAAARSDDAAAHTALVRRLGSEGWLGQLDSAAEYQMASRFRLHVAQVVEALAANPARSAQDAFIALTASATFLAHDERIIALIRSSRHIRPAPSELVTFWDRYTQPEDGFSPTTVTALVENGSEPAMALLERKMEDPGQEDDEKISWMRTDMLSHRNDVPLLSACERMLAGRLPEHLRPFLVEALFDYRPEEWFKPASSYSAPLLASASSQALQLILRIAALALRSVPLTERQRAAVERRRTEAETLMRGAR
jgi:hypothetical protein